MTAQSTAPAADTLGARQQAILPIAAIAAAGNITKPNAALNQGLDAGLTISDVREVLVQIYAYAGSRAVSTRAGGPATLNAALGQVANGLHLPHNAARPLF